MTSAIADRPAIKVKKEDTEYTRLKRDVQNIRDGDGNPNYVFQLDSGRYVWGLSWRLFAMLCMTIALFIATYSLPLLIAVPVAVVIGLPFGLFMTQISLFAHDVGHNSALANKRWEKRLALILGNAVLAVSHTWWTVKHNQHHSTPNSLEEDPDVRIPIAVFEAEQAEERSRFVQPILRHQHVLILPLFSLQAFNTQIRTPFYLGSETIKLIKKRRGQLPTDVRTLKAGNLLAQWVALILRWCLVAYFWVLTGWLVGLGFFLSYMLAHGFFNSSIFAPNHKGMPIVKKGNNLGKFREQVITARNVHGGRLTKFYLRNLGYQIEHHLFQQIASNKIHLIKDTVIEHCEMNGVPYTSMTLFESFREIYGELERVAHELQEKHRAQKLMGV